MTTVTIRQAKINLAKLIAKVEAGEEVVIVRGEKPVARLTGLEMKPQKPRFGILKGRIPDLPDGSSSIRCRRMNCAFGRVTGKTLFRSQARKWWGDRRRRDAPGTRYYFGQILTG